MVAVLVASDGFAFNDGNAGHAIDLGSAPNPGEWDVLCVNSDTVVTTPSGFTLRPNATDQQGAYIYTREASGGEAQTVTITTSGNHNTAVIWSRWSNIDDYSDGNFVRANNSNNTVLPSTSTGALAATGMLVIAFAALHNFDGAVPAAPSWGNGYSAIDEATVGGAGSSSSVCAFVGYKTNAGTAAEQIDAALSWTNAARNRYALWVSFTVTSGGEEHDADSTLSETGTLTGNGAVDRAASAALSETGGLAGTATVDRITGSALAAAGQVSVQATADQNVTSTLAGTGLLAGASTIEAVASVAVAGTGALIAAGAIASDRTSALTGTGGLALTAGIAFAADASLSVVGTLVTTATVDRAATAVLTGLGSLAAVSGQSHAATANLAGIGTLTAALPTEPGRHTTGTIRPRLTAFVGP